MSKTNGFENNTQLHVFQNAAIGNVGDVGGLQPSAAPGDLYVALYSSDPTETGAAGTEATFTNYARQAVVRSAAGWDVAASVASNAALVTFPQSGSTNAGGDISHFAICTAVTAGDVLYFGTLGTPRTIANGVTVEFAIGALTVTED